jgi:hypothetical protein
MVSCSAVLEWRFAAGANHNAAVGPSNRAREPRLASSCVWSYEAGMTDLIALSTQIIDDAAPIFPVRVNQELSEIADGVSVVESFSNVVAV